jgi:hypothetical protein
MAMTKILAAAALAVLIATPAYAQSMKNESSGAPLRSHAASDSQKGKSQTRRSDAASEAQPARVWSYSGNPEYDVYVRGEYVGSDPDPRVRSTLRAEATRSYGNRD